MPDQDSPSAPHPNASQEADQEERSSGKDEGDSVERNAHAKAENVERDSGRGSGGA